MKKEVGHSRVLYHKEDIPNKQLLLDVSTRWNSTVVMLRRVLEYKVPFMASKIRNLDRLRFSESGDIWEKISQMIKLLEPFEEATLMMSQGHSPTLSDTSAIYIFLFNHLEDYISGREKKLLATRSKTSNQNIQPEWLKNAAQAGWDKLQKYYANCDNLVYVISTILDPRFKLQWFKVSWQPQFVDAAKKKLLQVWNSRYKQLNIEVDDNFDTQATKNIADLIASKMKTPQRSEDDLTRYLSEPTVHSKRVAAGITSALDWWKANEKYYPQLSKMAKDFLAVSGTSVPVERYFSMGPDLLTLRRQKMKGVTVSKCMCLKHWLKSKKSHGYITENVCKILSECLDLSTEVGLSIDEP